MMVKEQLLHVYTNIEQEETFAKLFSQKKCTKVYMF